MNNIVPRKYEDEVQLPRMDEHSWMPLATSVLS